jgi:hypothetical protein
MVDGGHNSGQHTGYIAMNNKFFKATKRAVPTMAFWDPGGNASKCQRWTLTNHNTNNQAFYMSIDSLNEFSGYSSGTTSSSGIQMHYTADAEL